MLDLIRMEIHKLKYNYLIILLIGLLMSGGIVTFFRSGYMYYYNIEIWQQSGEMYTIILPFFAVAPLCWLLFYDRKMNLSSPMDMMTKWIVSSISGALIIFFISFIGLIISLYLIPTVEPYVSEYTIENYAGSLFINYPFLYGLVFSLWRAFIGFVIVSFGFVLWLYFKNIFVVFIGPFSYMVMENIVLGNLGVPYFRLITSFDPSTLEAGAITTGRLLVGPLILVIITVGLLCLRLLVKKVIDKV